MDRSKFYAALRARSSGVFGTSLTKGQVDGAERILDEAQRRGTPLRHLAYILSTAYHETAHTMQPTREKGGEKYLRSKRYYPWVGEGLVQVTWEENHRKFGVTAPGQMMTWPIALRAIFDGMTKGMFTGKKLDDYIVGEKCDYVGARRIVNGTDRAADLAGYAKTFETALRAAAYIAQAPQKLQIPELKPTPAPAPEPARGWLSRVLARLFS
ncbi:hypothetical protein [Aminobacter niigataensis]|uniref:hypothetical protein n=1 Tax=Aminobacter niigataensis TaxID=83265 RepID=UPI0024C695C7|nr:hypothetical protein [Aminobacter niigataensis]CAI2936236.1 conserved protein of unknown function [Aminobacter niigataensis]